jgi:putative transposase
MKKLWGRKVSDMAFGEFLQILQWIAQKKDKAVHFISRWYPSSKTCSNCQHTLEKLALSVRSWRCPECFKVNDRDLNAAENILNVGASTLGLGDIR